MARQSTVATIRLFFFLCFVSQSTAQDNSRQCYEVRNETICFFQPANGMAKNWDDADKLCRDNNATLPVIPNSDHQKTIETYFTQVLKQKNVVVFTAGRKSWFLDPKYPWRWVNGKQSRTPIIGVFTDDYIFGCIHRDTNMIPNGVISCSSYPLSFICQYPERICKTLDKAAYWLHDRSHCFVIYDERLSWYEARIKCFEGSGDLAIFDDVDSFMAFHNFTSAINKERIGFFSIGLQRKWWIWRVTESFDVRYTNWPQRRLYDNKFEDISGLDCLCINGSNNFKWASCSCSEGRSVLCKSATKVAVHDESLKERNNSNPQTDKFSNSSRCFDINGTQVCYFTPENATRLNFASASQWCRDHNATLPIIRNKIYQKSLESFLDTISLPIYLLWTSGLKVRTGIWSWINGNPFRESYIGDFPQFVSFDFRTRSPDTLEQKGQLLRSLNYAEYPKPNTGYVCQFQGDSCKAFNNGIRSKNGECLVVNEEEVSWQEARNRCIEGGGDLATLEDVSKIEKLASLLTSDKSYHIGLENSRWVWSQSDELEDFVQYANWKRAFSDYFEDEGEDDFSYYPYCYSRGYYIFKLTRQMENYCSCIETFTYKWTPCPCDFTFRFLCQRVMCASCEDNQGFKIASIQGLTIASVQGLIIAVLGIAVICLAIRLRKKNEAVLNSALDMQVKTDEGYISVNPTIESNPSEYQDLKLYEEVH